MPFSAKRVCYVVNNKPVPHHSVIAARNNCLAWHIAAPNVVLLCPIPHRLDAANAFNHRRPSIKPIAFFPMNPPLAF